MYFSQMLNQSGSLRPRSNSRGSSRQEKVPITIIRVAPYIYKDSLSIWMLQSAGYFPAIVCVNKEAAFVYYQEFASSFFERFTSSQQAITDTISVASTMCSLKGTTKESSTERMPPKSPAISNTVSCR